MIFEGTMIAPGIAHGPALVWAPASVPVLRREITPATVSAETRRLEQALELARRELGEIAHRVELNVGASAAAIFRAHQVMLEDPAFVAAIRQRIEEQHLAAETAAAMIIEEFVRGFAQIADCYLAARAADITEIGRRLLAHLREDDSGAPPQLAVPSILIAENLAATDVVGLDRTQLLGLVLLRGGATSHAALLAATLGVPVVGGAAQLAGQVHDGDTIVVDGNHGHVLVRPTELALREYITRREIFLRFHGELTDLRQAPAVTLDGRTVRVYANISLAEEIPHALAQGAEGIGLLRTEYFYLANREPPSEEEQYRYYAAVVQAAGNRPVTFRTFDLGGDKLSMTPSSPDANPMLACRGIRLFTEQRDLMAAQVRALLRASRHGPVRIMFPLVTSLAEFQDTMQLVKHWQRQLRTQGMPFDDTVPFGCMIETPAAATIPDILAEEVEFFSIGSNDLIQYTLAADRTNPRVTHLYEPLHLAVLRMMQRVIRAAQRKHRPVSLCGQMASDPIYTIILLGLGIDEFSVNPIVIPGIKQIIRSVTWAEAREVARGVLRERRAKDVQAFLEKMMLHRFPQVMSVYGAS
jgi:phosphoenolpyruvate-protein phosphotransferase (PTS system enzyme I)